MNPLEKLKQAVRLAAECGGWVELPIAVAQQILADNELATWQDLEKAVSAEVVYTAASGSVMFTCLDDDGAGEEVAS